MAVGSLKSLAWRSGFAGFALGSALVALSGAGAQGIAGFNSDAPVNYAADRIELQRMRKIVGIQMSACAWNVLLIRG